MNTTGCTQRNTNRYIQLVIALVTCDAGPNLDPDEFATIKALANRGVSAELVSWTADVDWAAYEMVIIRSTWDYHDNLPAFENWVAEVAKKTKLFNPPAAVFATSNKEYLAKLDKAGVRVVPTEYCAVGETPRIEFESEQYVVKPTVSAGSKNTFRVGKAQIADRVEQIHKSGRVAMIQPYIESVDTSGETGLLFFNGEYSHAFNKGAMLRDSRDFVAGLYKEEVISSAIPSAGEMHLAEQCLAAAPALGFSAADLLYARVDIVQLGQGDYRVLEFEVIEPSLFLAYGVGALDRFVDAIVTRL